MNYSKLIRVFAMAAFFGSMPLVVLAATTPANNSEFVLSGVILGGYNSPNVDAREQCIELDRKVNLEINQATHNSTLDPVAERAYLAAQRDFRSGQYDKAVSHLRQAEKALESHSNQHAAK